MKGGGFCTTLFDHCWVLWVWQLTVNRARIWRKTLSRYLQRPSFWCEGQYGKMDDDACLRIRELTEVKASWMRVGAGILTVTPWEIIGRDRLWWFCGENKMTLEKFLEEMMKCKWWIGKMIWATDYHWDYVSFIREKKKRMVMQNYERSKGFLSHREIREAVA